HAEAALLDNEWNEANARQAMLALDIDFQPLTDMRASSSYRLKVARNLLWRFHLETRDTAPLSPADVNVDAFAHEAQAETRSTAPAQEPLP
ncbi:MAG TPA: xanthine dehydrogenase small subunit, partial [Paraburkholderia sp.]